MTQPTSKNGSPSKAKSALPCAACTIQNTMNAVQGIPKNTIGNTAGQRYRARGALCQSNASPDLSSFSKCRCATGCRGRLSFDAKTLIFRHKQATCPKDQVLASYGGWLGPPPMVRRDIARLTTCAPLRTWPGTGGGHSLSTSHSRFPISRWPKQKRRPAVRPGGGI